MHAQPMQDCYFLLSLKITNIYYHYEIWVNFIDQNFIGENFVCSKLIIVDHYAVLCATAL